MDIERTRGLVFLDTNILVYTFDDTEKKNNAKRKG